MSTTSFGFRLRRTVPYRRTVDGVRYSVGIHRMQDNPAEATVGVTSADEQRQERLAVGDLLTVGSERWQVIDIDPGDRGTVDFAPPSHPEQEGENA